MFIEFANGIFICKAGGLIINNNMFTYYLSLTHTPIVGDFVLNLKHISFTPVRQFCKLFDQTLCFTSFLSLSLLLFGRLLFFIFGNPCEI